MTTGCSKNDPLMDGSVASCLRGLAWAARTARPGACTPGSRIDDGRRSARDWRRDGVYFLDDPDCLEQAIRDALEPAPGA